MNASHLAESPARPVPLSAEQAQLTGAFIAAQQQPDGSIPWYADGPFDHWDHIEAAMGLTISGRYADAERAFDWSAAHQRPDGSWPMGLHGGQVVDAHADTNQCAYLAVGLWHFHLATGRTAVLARLWPALERAVDFVIRAQRRDGAIAWAVAARPEPIALLTGCASIAQSLECALHIGELLGHERPRWQWARQRLTNLVGDPDCYGAVFADRSRFSMDWYYPILAGAIRGAAARRRMGGRWDTFVIAGRGARCVSDQPWVTTGESAELVAALHAIGDRAGALELFESLTHLRDDESGGYWTGRNVADGIIWPRELTTWSAAAVLLAADALTGGTTASAIFAGAGACEDDLTRIPDGAAS